MSEEDERSMRAIRGENGGPCQIMNFAQVRQEW